MVVHWNLLSSCYILRTCQRYLILEIMFFLLVDVTSVQYCILFPFSHGKTTLLRHIQSRALNIPPNIDVLYCEQVSYCDCSMI